MYSKISITTFKDEQKLGTQPGSCAESISDIRIAELSRHLATKPDYLLGFETEEDPYVITAVAILQGIKDEKIKALLIGQMQLAGKLGM